MTNTSTPPTAMRPTGAVPLRLLDQPEPTAEQEVTRFAALVREDIEALTKVKTRLRLHVVLLERAQRRARMKDSGENAAG